eukprot:TRINITY_DN17498_c0_g1_i1.p1 TRINITY_DN17498_c0_g1~~TRINITY_DN17498_c0_g1_i1.p1  ORF type:complete len:220 (+),score=59.49 TRINITY_DN17498_c0_g1_i1:119-778(+)
MADHGFDGYDDPAPTQGYDQPPEYEAHTDHFNEPLDHTDDFGAAPHHSNGPIMDDAFEPMANGNPLPPPEDLPPEESLVLREWRRKRAAELEEKTRTSQEKHAQILDHAAEDRERFYDQREKQVATSKTNNKEKEKVLLANLDSLMAKAGENYWEAVTGFINFDTQQDKKGAGKGKSATPRQSIVPEVKAGRQTDLARFRQILLKLKHTPPIRHPVAAA